ncbi:hypothetical protein [Nonomuraea sp. NPDC050202]|uniref:hypothetical protein n=1 Tax=Nonomuraea sp. NPDC050202 TaxID=3155035 RepID=UPI0033D01834
MSLRAGSDLAFHVTVRATCTAHVAEGKIDSHREYYDQLELYSRLGFGLLELDRIPAP